MKRCNSIAIIGAGGHAKVVAATLLNMGAKIDCFYDDNEKKWNSKILGILVKGPISVLLERLDKNVIIAVGDNQTRQNIAKKFKNVEWITAVHSHSCVHSSVKLGAGSVVFAGAVIQPGAVIGKHCIVNTGAVIDHDCIIGSYAHIAPGVKLAGNVKIGEGTLIGTGSSVSPGISVGEYTIVGVGSVVVSDLPPNITAYGTPAKVRKS